MDNSSYNIIVSRLDKVLWRYIVFSIIEAFLAALTIWSILFLAFGLYESGHYLSPAVKTTLFFSSFGVFAIIFVSLCTIRIIRCPRLDDRARLVERAYPHFRDRLVSAVQLGRLKSDELQGQSEDIVRALIENVDEETSSIDTVCSVSPVKLVLWARNVFGIVIIFLLLTILLPDYTVGGLYRLIDYSYAYMSPESLSIYLLTRENKIIRGENFSASGFLSGWDFEPLNVMYRWDDSQTWTVKPVDVDAKTGNFTMTIEKPRTSFQYYLESGSSGTPRYRVTIIERPVVKKIGLALTYPRYTGLGTVMLKDNDGNIRALDGTRVTMTVHANKTLTNMAVIWSDSTVSVCDVKGDTGTMAFTVNRTIDYHISLTDSLGISNNNPIKYRVTSLLDENPEVAIASPVSDITLPLSMTFPLIYRARDDYGLTSVTLMFTLPFEKNPREIILEKGALGKDIEDSFIWNMSDFSLLPGDTVSYFLVVYDNDTINGPKKGVSGTGIVRVPSMTDILTDAADTQDRGIEKLRDMSQRTAQEKSPLDDVRRNIINGKELDWSDKNAIEEAKKSMENIQKELKDLSGEIKNVAEMLSEENMAALETVEKFQKISQLMSEIADGEMKEALKQLTQASASIDPSKIKQAIDEHKVTAEDLKKKLDRIIALLEQVKAIQKFETAKRLVEEIAIKEADLTDNFRTSPRDSILWREQGKLASEMKTLQEELKNVAQDLKEKFEFDTQTFQEYLESKDISESMNQAQKNMKSGQKNMAEKDLDKSNAMLSELLEEMDKLGMAMEETNTEEIKRRLFTALGNMLAVSEKQENFLRDNELSGKSKDELAQRELEIIDALSKAEHSLRSLGELVMDVAGVFDQMMTVVKMSMQNAVDSYATGNTGTGESMARTSLSDINKSIYILTMLIKSGKSEGMGMPGDLMQQLQKIANGELSLQMQMGGAETEELMMQLAAEQQKLAEMLSELNNRISEDKRLQEMLEKLVKDMDDTAQMMRRNDQREYIERKQLDIYRRLLDARRSRREKDDSDERQSWTAKRNVSLGADQLAGDLGEKKKELNERIKQAMQDDFDAEYLRLIRRYFESMLQDYDILGKLDNTGVK